MKEENAYFSEVELDQNAEWVFGQNRQVLESKGVPIDPRMQKHCLQRLNGKKRK